MKVIIAQIGARQHYEIGKLCHQNGCLARLYTDYWFDPSETTKAILSSIPLNPVKRILGRNHSQIPVKLVRTQALKATYWRYSNKLCFNASNQFDYYVKWGAVFAQSVATKLNDENFTTFFGFSGASYEALVSAKRLGALTVLDEIAASHLQNEILIEENRRFAGWSLTDGLASLKFLNRIEQEWEAADRILVNSTWTRKALVQQGVHPSKIHVVPISYASKSIIKNVKSLGPGESLKVLWVGTLCLTKGFQYVIEAAKLLQGAPVSFTFVGPSDIDLSAFSWPSNATYVGQIPRINLESYWASHHLFIFPTLCDGFGLTQLEAIANGLPVIATPNCGEVVEENISGLIVSPRDASAIVDAIKKFLDKEISLEQASLAAIKRSAAFLPEQVWGALKTVLMK
jgi:glycosyltransferase involved in cell wall biosynthesis